MESNVSRVDDGWEMVNFVGYGTARAVYGEVFLLNALMNVVVVVANK